jgi:hypothetical protein
MTELDEIWCRISPCNVIGHREFHENCCSERYTLLWAENEYVTSIVYIFHPMWV